MRRIAPLPRRVGRLGATRRYARRFAMGRKRGSRTSGLFPPDPERAAISAICQRGNEGRGNARRGAPGIVKGRLLRPAGSEVTAPRVLPALRSAMEWVMRDLVAWVLAGQLHGQGSLPTISSMITYPARVAAFPLKERASGAGRTTARCGYGCYALLNRDARAHSVSASG